MASPRRAMGILHGHGVRFGFARHSMVAGEGLETVLSIRSAVPALPAVAALSAAHLAALELAPSLHRLYIAEDADPAGRRAARALSSRALEAGIGVIRLTPRLNDFNTDLTTFGLDALRIRLRDRIDPADLNELSAPSAPP